MVIQVEEKDELRIHIEQKPPGAETVSELVPPETKEKLGLPGPSLPGEGAKAAPGAAPPAEEKAAVSIEQAELFVATCCGIMSAVLETGAKAICKVPEAPMMGFNEGEKGILTKTWSPFVPAMSPLTAAIVTTGIILGGKAVIFYGYYQQGKQTIKGAG